MRVFKGLAIAFLLAPLLGAIGDEASRKDDATQAWRLIYEYSEVPPNPGAGAPCTRIHFECDDSGRFALSQTVHSVSGALLVKTNSTGELPCGSLANLRQRLAAADFPTLTNRQFALPGASGTEDGWGGRICYVRGPATNELSFHSHGGWPVDKAKQQEVRRLMDFIHSMNGILLPQAGRRF